MTTRLLSRAFIASLVVTLILLFLINQVWGASGDVWYVKCLFAATVLVEAIALWQAANARRIFSKNDPGHLTWTLILAFLVVRLVAELRLISLTFDVVSVPKPIDTASPLLFIYIVAFRYTYTLSDILFVAALITTVRTYKSTGLKFEILKQDYLYILLLWSIPILTFVFRENVGLTGLTGSDPYIGTYRLVAVFIGAIIASLCVVVRRYAVQMGGGAVARIWNTVVVAGIARDASFLVLALLSRLSEPTARFGEQFLLWIFAGCWLIAAMQQQEVLLGVTRQKVVAPAESPELA